MEAENERLKKEVKDLGKEFSSSRYEWALPIVIFFFHYIFMKNGSRK